jgi:hypothetical protein
MKNWNKGKLLEAFTNRSNAAKVAAAVTIPLTLTLLFSGCASMTSYNQVPDTGTYNRGALKIPTDSEFSGKQSVKIHPDGTLEAQEGSGTITYGGGRSRRSREGALDRADDALRQGNRILRGIDSFINRINRLGD